MVEGVYIDEEKTPRMKWIQCDAWRCFRRCVYTDPSCDDEYQNHESDQHSNMGLKSLSVSFRLHEVMGDCILEPL